MVAVVVVSVWLVVGEVNVVAVVVVVLKRV